MKYSQDIVEGKANIVSACNHTTQAYVGEKVLNPGVLNLSRRIKVSSRP